MFVYVSLSPTVTAVNHPFAVTIIFDAYGFEFQSYGISDDDRRELSVFLQKVPGLIGDGKLKPAPIKKFGGGLDKVYSDGFKYFSEGKVSAERVVFAL